ncbi:hypothetical protein HY384_04080 [Candidatus Daviesbacteria bacterium]|nr:hypothetical protein [Candidatus Daviesbacteria bacterium]
MSNPCIRCGKQRLDGKTWKGKIGSSTVTYTLTICPDAGCQKIVDQVTAERKEKSALLIKKKAEAKLAKEKLVAGI